MPIRSKKTLRTLKTIQTITETELTFASLLRSIRQGEAMTQLEFAEVLAVSKQYLCDLECGRRFVSPKTAADYAQKLGYSETQFVRLCLQDLVTREGLNFIVDLKKAA